MEGVLEERPKKPRKVGVTQAVDRFEGIAQDEFAALSDAVDIVKIRWGLPLLLEEEALRRRIRLYHQHRVKVSTGGTLTNLMLRASKLKEYLAAAKGVGFDFIEVSEGAAPLSDQRHADLARQIQKAGLTLLVKVGTPDPRRQPAPAEVARLLQRGFDAGSPWGLLEAGDGRAVGPYDREGAPDWESIDRLDSRFGRDRLVFEAPLESQQASLLLHFGPDVNLGAIDIAQIASLESMRLGVRAGATFGMRRRPRAVEGSPALKFIAFLITQESVVDQGRLCQLSGLPRRTVQKALDQLKREGHVQEVVSLEDPRRKLYKPA